MAFNIPIPMEFPSVLFPPVPILTENRKSTFA